MSVFVCMASLVPRPRPAFRRLQYGQSYTHRSVLTKTTLSYTHTLSLLFFLPPIEQRCLFIAIHSLVLIATESWAGPGNEAMYGYE